MKPTTNIHALHDGTINTARAILDLLHLEQLGLAPASAAAAPAAATTWQSNDSSIDDEIPF